MSGVSDKISKAKWKETDAKWQEMDATWNDMNGIWKDMNGKWKETHAKWKEIIAKCTEMDGKKQTYYVCYGIDSFVSYDPFTRNWLQGMHIEYSTALHTHTFIHMHNSQHHFLCIILTAMFINKANTEGTLRLYFN